MNKHLTIISPAQENELWSAAVVAATDLLRIFSFPDFFFASAATIAKLMNADGAALIGCDGKDQLRYKLFFGLEEVNQDSVLKFKFPITKGTVGRALSLGKPLFTPDYQNSPDAMAEFVAAGMHANLVFPMSGPTGYLGAIAISWLHRDPPVIEPRNLIIAEMFAALVGSAMYREALQTELEEQSLHDALTGLPNRRMLLMRLAGAQERAKRDGTLMAVAMIDLDGFKAVNDRFGHLAGDELLASAGGRIRETIRAADMAARIGGDEFFVVLEDVGSVGEAAAVFERILGALHMRIGDDPGVGRISASIGATFYPLNQEDPETLMQHADLAMYCSKGEGGNRVSLRPFGAA